MPLTVMLLENNLFEVNKSDTHQLTNIGVLVVLPPTLFAVFVVDKITVWEFIISGR